jgi:hypothetical protein
MAAIVEHVRRNAVAYVALFVALGGTGYAATSLPRASVGARQIKNHSIQPVKFDPQTIGGSVRAWAVVASTGHLVEGGGKPRVVGSPVPGDYGITWGVNLNTGCAAIANVDLSHSPVTETVPIPGNPSVPFTAGYAVVENFSAGKGRHENNTTVHTFDQDGRPTDLGFDVAVIC